MKTFNMITRKGLICLNSDVMKSEIGQLVNIQAVRYVRLCACRTEDHEDSLNLISKGLKKPEDLLLEATP